MIYFFGVVIFIMGINEKICMTITQAISILEQRSVRVSIFSGMHPKKEDYPDAHLFTYFGIVCVENNKPSESKYKTLTISGQTIIDTLIGLAESILAVPQ